MDKVQIYYAVLLVLGFSVRGYKAYTRPMEIDSTTTNAQSAALTPLGILGALPIAGRIFGWW